MIFCYTHWSIPYSVIIREALSCDRQEPKPEIIWKECPWNTQPQIGCVHQIPLSLEIPTNVEVGKIWELGELRTQEKNGSLNQLRGLIWTLRDGNNQHREYKVLIWVLCVYSIVFSLGFLYYSWIVYPWDSDSCSWSWGSFFLLGYLVQLCCDDFFNLIKYYYVMFGFYLKIACFFFLLRDRKFVVLGNRRSGEEMVVLYGEEAEIIFYCAKNIFFNSGEITKFLLGFRTAPQMPHNFRCLSTYSLPKIFHPLPT